MFAPSYRNIYLLIVAENRVLNRAAANSRFLTKIRWDRVDTEGFEPHDERNNLLLDSFIGDRMVYEKYKEMVEELEKNKDTVPKEIRNYHMKGPDGPPKNKKGSPKRPPSPSNSLYHFTHLPPGPTIYHAKKLVELYQLEIARIANKAAHNADLRNRFSSNVESGSGCGSADVAGGSGSGIRNGMNAGTNGDGANYGVDVDGQELQQHAPAAHDPFDQRTSVLQQHAGHHILYDKPNFLAIRALYLLYLEKRKQGLTSFRAMFEVNRTFNLTEMRGKMDNSAEVSKLCSVWDRLGCECGPLWVAHPYSPNQSNVPWAQHRVRNLLGKKVATNFSPADRLELISNLIEQQLDLADLVLVDDGVFLRDYFPFEDLRLN
eukprot:g2301.t1